MEELLANGAIPLDEVGVRLSLTPFQDLWVRGKGGPRGLSALLQEMPGVQIFEDALGRHAVKLVEPPKQDRGEAQNIYVDGSYIDSGTGFGGIGAWAVLLPGVNLAYGSRSGCKPSDVEAEAILFGLEQATGDVVIHTDCTESIKRFQPAWQWKKREPDWEFQRIWERYCALRKGRKVRLTYTKYHVGLPPHIGGIAITDKYASSPCGSATRGKASNRG
jgi:hypothetical protein